MTELTLWPIAVSYNYHQCNKQQYWRWRLYCLGQQNCLKCHSVFVWVSSTIFGQRQNMIELVCTVRSNLIWYEKFDLIWTAWADIKSVIWYEKSNLIWKIWSDIKSLIWYEKPAAFKSKLRSLFTNWPEHSSLHWVVCMDMKVYALLFPGFQDLEFKLPVYIPFYWEPQILQFFKE